MYYLYISRGYDFSSPKYLIVEYLDHYFYRGKNTDWFEMDPEDIDTMLSGKDNQYFAIEEEQYTKIIKSWGGSTNGYKSMNIHHEYDHEGYADSYDEEDESYE